MRASAPVAPARELSNRASSYSEATYAVHDVFGTAECPCGFADAINASLSRNTGFSSIYTRADEVVHWESCIEEAGSNLEMSGRHLSLIVNREVYRLLSAILVDQEVERGAA